MRLLCTGKSVIGSPAETSRESTAGDAVPSDRHFKENGARLLVALIASSGGNTNPIRMFSAKELADATDNYNPKRYLGKGISKVYSGFHDDRPIAVKRAFARFFDEPGLFDMFLNEVVTLSQICHRNVVRLLGCCIETRAPILVYELVPGGTTLSRLLHPNSTANDPRSAIPWADRLRIALEVAGAINYLHTALRVPIVHCSIKPRNIFLDSCCRAKVGAFGYSEVLVPRKEEQLSSSSRRNTTRGVRPPNAGDARLGRQGAAEKDDVYAFGLLLIELLTGKRPTKKHNVCSSRCVHVDHFISLTRDDALGTVLDVAVSALSAADREQQMACAHVAVRCVTEDGEGSPVLTMKEVVRGLRLTGTRK